MTRRHDSSSMSLGLIAVCVMAVASAAGCDSSAGLIGKWETDRTPLLASPSGENDLAVHLSPQPKFAIEFFEDGKFISSWQENGQEATRQGTWKILEDQGIKWRITIKLPPDDEEWNVKVVSPENRKLSLEAEDAFRKGGPIYFKKNW